MKWIKVVSLLKHEKYYKQIMLGQGRNSMWKMRMCWEVIQVEKCGQHVIARPLKQKKRVYFICMQEGVSLNHR